jgi:hypothetical protein
MEPTLVQRRLAICIAWVAACHRAASPIGEGGEAGKRGEADFSFSGPTILGLLAKKLSNDSDFLFTPKLMTVAATGLMQSKHF